MQVARWGNSLAVRIPASVVEALELSEGDDIDIQVAGRRQLDVSCECSRAAALKRIARFQIKLPPDWRFDREEANAR